MKFGRVVCPPTAPIEYSKYVLIYLEREKNLLELQPKLANLTWELGTSSAKPDANNLINTPINMRVS